MKERTKSFPRVPTITWEGWGFLFLLSFFLFLCVFFIIFFFLEGRTEIFQCKRGYYCASSFFIYYNLADTALQDFRTKKVETLTFLWHELVDMHLLCNCREVLYSCSCLMLAVNYTSFYSTSSSLLHFLPASAVLTFVTPRFTLTGKMSGVPRKMTN